MRQNQKTAEPAQQTIFQRVIWLLNTFASVGITYYFLNKIANQNYNLVFLYKSSLPSQLIQSFLIFISLLLFLYTFSADWLEIVFGKTQNILYQSHKKVIDNNILWSFIFLGLYYYGAKIQKIQVSEVQIMIFDLFLVGRIIFSIGYTIGSLIKHQSFRAIGFGLSFSCVVLLLCQNIGYPLLKHFK